MTKGAPAPRTRVEHLTDLSGRRILFVINVDWFFLSHYVGRAIAALRRGAEVHVACGITDCHENLKALGLRVHPIALSRSGVTPWQEARTFVQIAQLFAHVQPALVHLVTAKPVLYGTVAARAFPRLSVVCSLSGMGYVFTERDRATWLRIGLQGLYRVGLANPRAHVIFQNPDDRADFIENRLLPRERSFMVRGSGVDCERFVPQPEPAGPPVVMLASRMLWDKGVAEFVRASQILTRAGVGARFVLVGGTDPGNPASVDEGDLKRWVQEGIVEWWGQQTAMNEVLPKATIVVLPSYREGLPKVLLEASACGKPIVTTDVRGCREIVRHEENGLLVAPRNAQTLASAVQRLLSDPAERVRMGRSGRTIVESDFSNATVEQETLEIYQEVLTKFRQ